MVGAGNGRRWEELHWWGQGFGGNTITTPLLDFDSNNSGTNCGLCCSTLLQETLLPLVVTSLTVKQARSADDCKVPLTSAIGP
jgi:hypothetical protein